MAILGDDVMQEILFRLTVIEIANCKAVCKAWRSLISSADFVSAHLQRSKSDPSTHCLLVHDDLPRPRFLSPTKPGICCSYSVVGSVNGLICLVGLRSDSDIFIVNPVTGLSRQLPNSDVGYMPKFAFWCDADVYKLAKIFFQLDAPTKVEVWDSSFPDQWTQVSTDPDLRFHTTEWESDSGVLVEGVAAYWILTDRDGDAFVVWLDFKTLLLDSIPLSKRQSSVLPTDIDWRAIRGIGESFLFGTNFKGKFALVQNSYTAGHTYHIWTMAMDANGGGVGWNKTSTIRIDIPFFRCLGSANGNKLVLMSVSDGIALYDMETGTKQSEKDVFGEHYSNTDPDTTHDFVGSLVSIQGFEFNDNLRSLNVSWPYSYTQGRVRKMQKPLPLPPPQPPPKSRPPPPPPPPPRRAASHMYRLLHQQMQMHKLTMSMLSSPPPLVPKPSYSYYSHTYRNRLLRRQLAQAPLCGRHPPPPARISSPPPAEWWPPTPPPQQQLNGGPHPMQFMFMHPPKSLYY